MTALEKEAPAEPIATVTSPRAWIAYAAPMIAFMALTALEGYAPKFYVGMYLLKALVVTVCLIASRSVWKEIRPNGRMLLLGALVGAAVFAEWIWLDKLTHYPHFTALFGKRVAYNPVAEIASPSLRTLFLVVRFYGLALMVPVMEELFWRSFLLRFATDPEDFQRLPVGAFSWTAFAIVAAGFAFAHPEWLEALICAVAYGLLLRQTRSLFACVTAHVVTNLMLGIYVLTTQAWHFW